MSRPLLSLKSRLSSLAGFKKYAAAFALGMLMTLAMPPVGAFYLLLACVPGFIWLARANKTKTEAFLTGWAFGAGYFILGLYWISFALFVDIRSFWWVLPLSVVAGPTAFALYYGFIPLLAWRWRGHEALHALMIAAGWALVEWVRGHALTGFPWNLIGYTWHTLLPLMQANALLGIYGLTLLTLLWAAMPALALTQQRRLVAPLMALFVAAGAYGLARLALHPAPPPEAAESFAVRIVQPNIPQSFKWDRDEVARNFLRHLDLTAAPAPLSRPFTFVIWPETAVAADLRQDAGAARAIAEALPEGATALIGSLRRTENDEFYNSVVALDKKAEILGIYDKHHLVPFGEYIPFRHYLNLTPVAAGIAMVGDFTRGRGVSTLRLDGLPAPSPLVCYEVIFPGAVASRVDRPSFLLNVTNDAWYGKTAGPHQHFEISRVRAVEEGLPLARAANTGISAAFDPLGRVLGMKKLEETGVVDAVLPPPLPPTLYARLGDTPFFLMLVLLAAAADISYRRRKPTG